MPETTIHLGADTEVDYLVRRYDDDTLTVCTRPLGGYRWSPEVTLVAQPAEVCS